MNMRFALVALALLSATPAAQAQDQTGVVQSSDQCVPTRRVRCPTAAEILAAANAAARQRADDADFAGARHIYAYAPGAIYELIASTNYVSAILLEPGEAVTAIAAGDTTRWMVTEAEAESASAARAVVLVKPMAAGVRTNIIIITDRRTYTIEARVGASEAYAVEIAWSYPETALQPAGAAQADTLNFAYRVRTVRGQTPVWSPARVFDDGARTYVEFAPGVAVREMPPLFVITAEGAELANYRVAGQRLVVDRLFDRAELRMGVRAPVIVRIERHGAPAERRRARRGGRP